jgi:hypothetical protein
MTKFIELFFYLTAFHALADFALQTGWLQHAKNHRDPAGAERADGGLPVWPLALSAHALIHAGGVALLTGSVTLGLLEFAAHAVIDYLKSDGRFGIYLDQLLHLLCKSAWAVAAIAAGRNILEMAGV